MNMPRLQIFFFSFFVNLYKNYIFFSKQNWKKLFSSFFLLTKGFHNFYSPLNFSPFRLIFFKIWRYSNVELALQHRKTLAGGDLLRLHPDIMITCLAHTHEVCRYSQATCLLISMTSLVPVGGKGVFILSGLVTSLARFDQMALAPERAVGKDPRAH